MKKILRIIVIILLILCFVIIYITTRRGSDQTMTNDKIGRTYDTPSISSYSYVGDTITVDAGMYRYGDINQDGIIDSKDKDMFDLFFNSSVSFTEDQKQLAKIKDDAISSENMIDLLEDYISKNKEKYDTKKDLLMYCLSDNDSVKNCNWQESNTFKVKENKDYYIFVKNKDTNAISNSTLVKKVADISKITH